jgi:predicted aminopeptidase
VVLVVWALLPSTGCYYAHLARGQARLLLARQSVDAALEDPGTPPDLRDKLALVIETRSFAPTLGLNVDGQYTSYADWPGDRVVTSVVATRPGEIDPAPFRFPIVGEVPYKGFFEVTRAQAEADRLTQRGYDVCLVPVSAYSTLGWFDDPVTTPLLRADPGRLVETLLHELTHATVFAPSAARFNEGIATFVGQEAALRFFALRDGPDSPTYRRELERVADDRQLALTLAELRAEIADLYEAPESPEREQERAELSRRARAHVAALPLQQADPDRLAENLRLSDACLALLGTYESDLPAYADHLRTLGGDLAAFLREARGVAESEDPVNALVGPGQQP